MEDTLRGVLDSLKEGFDKVLILVLMEDTLRVFGFRRIGFIRWS